MGGRRREAAPGLPPLLLRHGRAAVSSLPPAPPRPPYLDGSPAVGVDGVGVRCAVQQLPEALQVAAGGGVGQLVRLRAARLPRHAPARLGLTVAGGRAPRSSAGSARPPRGARGWQRSRPAGGALPMGATGRTAPRRERPSAPRAAGAGPGPEVPVRCRPRGRLHLQGRSRTARPSFSPHSWCRSAPARPGPARPRLACVTVTAAEWSAAAAMGRSAPRCPQRAGLPGRRPAAGTSLIFFVLLFIYLSPPPATLSSGQQHLNMCLTTKREGARGNGRSEGRKRLYLFHEHSPDSRRSPRRRRWRRRCFFHFS